MRLILLLNIVLLLVLSSCELVGSKDAVQPFVPGTYCSEWSSEFSATRDTLLIRAVGARDPLLYQVTRRTFHRYEAAMKKRPPEYKVEQWMATYAQREKVLLVHKNGRVLSFDPDRKEMRMGVTVYKKL